MKFVENVEVQKQIKKLSAAVAQTAQDILVLLEMVSDGETDDIEALDIYRNNVFEIGADMFKQKMELLKVQKAIDKHIAHTLNPIDKTAPKTSARKTKSVVHVKVDKAITIKRKKDV